MRLKYFMFLVFCSGDSALTSRRFMLAVDGHHKFPDRHRNVDALMGCILISTLNREAAIEAAAAVEAAATLEFIQRYVSPDR